MLGGSGFMGVAIGSVLPGERSGSLRGRTASVAVPLLIPLLLIATGQLGLNPVAVVALIGAAVPDPAALGVPPAVLAFACMLGWGLGVTMTPMSSSAIITARWAGVSPWIGHHAMERSLHVLGAADGLGCHRGGISCVAQVMGIAILDQRASSAIQRARLASSGVRFG